MRHYIALLHKEPTSSYGVSFPDIPGVVTAAESMDDALQQAADVLVFAAEDWEKVTGKPFPEPRTLDALRADRSFLADSADAVVAAIPFPDSLSRAA